MLTLFDSPPAQAHSETSKAAARAIRPDANRLRDSVYAAIREAGANGLTDEELIILTAMNPSTARPRRGELVDLGRVVDSGRTRLTHSKRKATVWITTEHQETLQ